MVIREKLLVIRAAVKSLKRLNFEGELRRLNGMVAGAVALVVQRQLHGGT